MDSTLWWWGGRGSPSAAARAARPGLRLQLLGGAASAQTALAGEQLPVSLSHLRTRPSYNSPGLCFHGEAEQRSSHQRSSRDTAPASPGPGTLRGGAGASDPGAERLGPRARLDGGSTSAPAAALLCASASAPVSPGHCPEVPRHLCVRGLLREGGRWRERERKRGERNEPSRDAQRARVSAEVRRGVPPRLRARPLRSERRPSAPRSPPLPSESRCASIAGGCRATPRPTRQAGPVVLGWGVARHRAGRPALPGRAARPNGIAHA